VRAEMNQDAVLQMFELCDNSRRWGPSSRRGTLNFQTTATCCAAAAEVRSGEIVALARPLTSTKVIPGYEFRLLTSESPDAVEDEVRFASHGFGITHLDAVGHTLFQGRAFGGVPRDRLLASGSLGYSDVTDLLPGIFTRGVLLDVPAARGVDHLEPGEGISMTDIAEAESLAGTRVGSGDAIFIRSGILERLRRSDATDTPPREGILPEVVQWIHDAEVAVFSGDCIERLPSGYPEVPLPLHQIGHVAMGLVILDNVDTDVLLRACQIAGRSTFLVVCSPLPIVGGSASPVNPLAIF